MDRSNDLQNNVVVGRRIVESRSFGEPLRTPYCRWLGFRASTLCISIGLGYVQIY